jgi:hypothetical protein
VTVVLETRARVTVENATAVGPLRETERAAAALGQEMRAAGAQAQAGGRQVAAAANVAASARREEERATMAAIKAIQLYGAEARAASQSAAAAARQTRMAYQQLGFQISDVASQAAVGTNPMVIFAQQGGQIAFALSGAAGVIGRVATFLAGPWGAAVLGAGAVLGVLASDAGEAGDAADTLADRYGEAGERIQSTFIDPIADSVRAVGDLVSTGLGAVADAAIAGLDEAAKAVMRFRELVDENAGEGTFGRAARTLGGLGIAGVPGAVLGLASSVGGGRSAQRRRDERAIRADNERFSRANEIFDFDPFDTKNIGKWVREVGAARQEAEREAKRLADTASREAQRAADAAAREAKRAIEEQARAAAAALAALARARDSFVASDTSPVAAAARDFGRELGRRQGDLQNDELRGLADAAEKRRLDAIAAGKAQAAAIREQLLADSSLLGQALGGRIGNAIGSAAEGLRTGDFRGLGRGGAALTLLARSEIFSRDNVKRITDKLDRIFGGESGDGTFTRGLGRVLQGAAFGASVAEIVGRGSKEEKIGGAIGGAAGAAAGSIVGVPELGRVIGSVLGTVVGGLFVGARTGSVTLGGAGGDVRASAATGTGGAQRLNASSLGGAVTDGLNELAARLGGTIGEFAVSIGQNGKFFRVDPTGQGRNSKRDPGVLRFGEDANAAVQAALADAIRDGAIAGVSPRVQAALQRYATDVNRALAEALKVQDLETQLANRLNPFAKGFQDFERQAAERLKVARQNGFDLVEIEALNAEERKKLLESSLRDAASSARALLDSLRFGGRAEGSVTERLAGLQAERERLQGLVDGGDLGQIDALARVLEQQLDVSREGFGSTGRFASDRAGTVATLEALVRQTEAKVNDAAAQAQRQTVERLEEANSSLDDLVTLQQRALAQLERLGTGGGSALDFSAFARAAV